MSFDPYSQNRFADDFPDDVEPLVTIKGKKVNRAKVKLEFETYDEYLEARQAIDERMAYIREEGYTLDYKFNELGKLNDDLTASRKTLENEVIKVEARQNFLKDVEGALDKRAQVLDDQHEALKVVTRRLEAANRDPLDVINEVLLQLELDVDPAEIAKHVREIGKSLDVKW